jgi:hypothetical protein
VFTKPVHADANSNPHADSNVFTKPVHADANSNTDTACTSSADGVKDRLRIAAGIYQTRDHRRSGAHHGRAGLRSDACSDLQKRTRTNANADTRACCHCYTYTDFNCGTDSVVADNDPIRSGALE